MNKKIFHPFLFAAYPVLALLARNIEEISASTALRPLLLSILGAALLFLVFHLWLKDAHKAALACSLTAILFFAYGHLYNFLEPFRIADFSLGRHRLFIPIWLAAFVLVMWRIVRTQKDMRLLTRSLNAIAAIALVFPIFQLGAFELRTLRVPPAGQASSIETGQLRLPTSQPAPDIYYIILDGYARDDMLAKFYQLDNSPFLEELSGLGFYVARCSQSNYAQTQLSLASSLNINYVDAFGDPYTSGNTSRVGLAKLVKDSAVRQALEGLGYTTVAFETGYDATQLEDADIYLSSQTIQGISDFENLFIRTTAARVLSEGVAFLHIKPDWEARDQAQRERILFTLEKLREMPDIPGPKFVFAHIVSPHWPHVFGPNGEKVHEHPNSISGYRNQVIFLNKQISTLVQEIISRSQTQPVIILQGDHGAVIEEPQRRMSILNAYYLPLGGDQLLYENISPVNSFRLIFNHYFDGHTSFLEDKSYYSRYQTPYEFQFVPNERPGCATQSSVTINP